MLWLLIWRRALPTPSATSPALHGSSLQPLLVSVWSSTQRSSCSDPSYLIRPARSTPKNKAGGGAARKGSASAVFVGFTRKKTAAHSDGTYRRLVFYNTINTGIVPVFQQAVSPKNGFTVLGESPLRCAFSCS